MFYIRYLTIQSAHACWCNKAVIVWLCACTGDNPLAKARVLSPVHTHKPYNNLHIKRMGICTIATSTNSNDEMVRGKMVERDKVRC